MHANFTKRFTLMLVLALAGMAVFAMHAPAKGDKGSRDADADGVSNRCEYQAKTDPNVADSDANAVVDGDEDTDGDGATNRAESNLHSNCGRANSHRRIRRATVTSFTAPVLVLTVRGGGTVTAPVADNLKCSTKGTGKISKCTTADLTDGTKVHNAKIKGGKYVQIRLIK